MEKESNVNDYLTVQIEGKRRDKRKKTIYNLDVIISVGYRIKSKQRAQFRIWATKVLKDYNINEKSKNTKYNQLRRSKLLIEKINKLNISAVGATC